MLCPEVWLGKPLSQARIQGRGRGGEASLAPVATSQQGGQPQSNLAPGLGSLEPWPPFEHSLPHSLVLCDQILTFWSSEHSCPSPLKIERMGATQRPRTFPQGRNPWRAAMPTARNAGANARTEQIFVLVSAVSFPEKGRRRSCRVQPTPPRSAFIYKENLISGNLIFLL